MSGLTTKTHGLTTNRMRQAWGVLFAVGLLAEAVAVVRPQRSDTLSELVGDVAEAWPPLPIAVGLVAGHWFPRTKQTALLLGGIALGMALWPLSTAQKHLTQKRETT